MRSAILAQEYVFHLSTSPSEVLYNSTLVIKLCVCHYKAICFALFIQQSLGIIYNTSRCKTQRFFYIILVIKIPKPITCVQNVFVHVFNHISHHKSQLM